MHQTDIVLTFDTRSVRFLFGHISFGRVWCRDRLQRAVADRLRGDVILIPSFLSQAYMLFQLRHRVRSYSDLCEKVFAHLRAIAAA